MCVCVCVCVCVCALAQTALFKYNWSLKDQGQAPQVNWKIVRQSSIANSFNSRCNSCIDKKMV